MRHFTRLRTSAVWLTALVVMATLWISTPAAMAGSATAWTITDMSGRVNIVRSGAAPVSLTNGDQLRPGDLIETAADSSAILVRNGESIVIAPNSRMGLPSTNDSGFATLILQQFGTLLLKVEKQQQQHFEVKTPYLAAVVKGTTFTVNVDAAGASVHVVEGLVQVANKTGMSAFVRPGQTALVSSAPGAGLSVKGAPANTPVQRSEVKPDQDATAPGDSAADSMAAIDVLPAAMNVSPVAFVIEDTVGTLDIDVSAATNGLIQPAQVPGQIGKAGTSQGTGSTGATTLASTSGTTGAGTSLSGSSNLGASPGNSGAAPGISGGGGVAAGHTGVLPATASSVAQLVASPGSQGNNGQNKKVK